MNHFLRLTTYYLRLIKYILSAAIGLSACIGYYLSIHSAMLNNYLEFRTRNLFGPDLSGWNWKFGICFIGVFLLASGANALNQYLERNTDKLMERTKSRPIPSGKISPVNTFIISLILILSGAFILSFLNITAMFLGLLNVVIYDFLYTPLKYKSIIALIPGGLVGAIPPVIGWFASGKAALSNAIIYFSVFMFLWQIPHFIIINLRYKEDYKNAGIVSIAGFFNISKTRSIMLIWLISAGLMSLLFPFASIVTTKLQLLFLLLINISAITFFSYLVLNKNENYLYKGNIYIHIYLLFLFLIILAG